MMMMIIILFFRDHVCAVMIGLCHNNVIVLRSNYSSM